MAEFTPEQIVKPKYPGRDRYFLIEATGRCQVSGFYQRPAAERRAKHHGYGIWDQRESVIVRQPNANKRIERLTANAEYHRKLAEDDDELIVAIKRTQTSLDNDKALRTLGAATE